MIISTILTPLLSHLWWVIPLVVLASISKTPWFKGYLGELTVRLSAKFLLDPAVYRPLHNVTLKTPDGTTQIDHVFVSRHGVFVVETKNYAGWIFGDENQANWTQKIYKTTHRFQNPLRQNYKHIKAIEALLGIPAEKIFTVIVFVGGSTFKTPMPPQVTYAGEYIRYIKSKSLTLFSDTEVEEMYQSLASGRLKPSLATNREHINHLKQRSVVNAKHLCPKCGSEMVLRTVKTGEKAGQTFWGCSQFPKCRTMQKTA